MNVVGHGIDVVDVMGLSKIFRAKFELVKDYYFTNQEIAEFTEQRASLSKMCGKIAVKEAVLKSLGLGLGRGVSFNQIEVTRENGALIQVSLSGAVSQRAKEMSIAGFLSSLSYCEQKAYASVLATCL